MRYPLMFLKFIGKGVANAVGGGIAGDLIFEVIPEVAADAYKWWKKDRKPDEQIADLQAVANVSPADLKEEVKQIVEEVAGDKPPEFKKDLEIYLSLVPGQLRKSIRRPSDPGGTTVGIGQLPQKPEDIVPLLPTKLPRFKVGDRPLPGVDWELEELLGVGGFGEVWKARNPLLDGVPPVALKFCLDPNAAQYLRNEAAVLNHVMRHGRHPHIVTLERTYLSSETPCLEYEYVAGGDLSGLIQEWHRSETKPTPAEITRVFCKLAEVIGHAHAASPPIVHRDLKPANVLRQLCADGSSVLKVADFGIGGVCSRQAIHEQTRGASMGRGGSMFLATALRGSCTPLYASVQQMRGDAPDPRDDVYSLGVIWYQMLTGDLTQGRPGGAKWGKRLNEAGLDARLVEVMAECFEDGLEDRIADAAVLARRINEILPADGKAADIVVKCDPPAAVRMMVQPLVTQMPARMVDPGMRRPNPVAEKERQRVADLEHEAGKLEVIIDSNPDDVFAWARRGEVYRQLGKQDRAIADCTEAIRIDSNLAQAYSTRGGAYRMKGEYDLAIADCTRAVELDPTLVLAWYHRGESRRMKNQLDRAIEDLTQALTLDATYSWAFGSRGAAYRQKGDYAKAIEDLDENLRLDPVYAWGWAVRGETYRLKGDLDRAIVDCGEALKHHPGLGLAYATRGAAFRQKGDFATALADLREALRLQPGNQFARDQMNLAQRRTK